MGKFTMSKYRSFAIFTVLAAVMMYVNVSTGHAYANAVRATAYPSWLFGCLGAVMGVMTTVRFYSNGYSKSFALAMTATAAIVLGGFWWVSQAFALWPHVITFAQAFGSGMAPFVVAGVTMAYVGVLFLIVIAVDSIDGK